MAVRTALLLALALLLVAADAPDGTAVPELVFTFVAAPVILAVIGAVRATPLLAGDRASYAGLASLILGILLGVGWSLYGNDPLGGPFLGGIHGLIAGATASGLYSTSKNASAALSRPS